MSCGDDTNEFILGYGYLDLLSDILRAILPCVMCIVGELKMKR